MLGGTRFVGRALVEAALAAGHRVTLFNRGLSAPGLFPGVETVLGDRTADLSALAGRSWDAVVDVAGYEPEAVRRSVAALSGRVGRYVFVSSLSVLADQATVQDEDGELLDLDRELPPHQLYGARKARCERIVLDAFGERASVVRPGLIVGPHDSTDRFPYWPRRFRRGGRVLLPGDPADPAQFIDVRDLAAWILDCVTAGRGGPYHVTGRPLPFGEFFAACRAVVNPAAEPVWIDSARLLRAGVEPWMGVPMWIASPECAAINRVDVSRALAAGLAYRPLAETIADTLAWDTARGGPAPDARGLAAEGLSAAAERRLLELLEPLG
ncbi:MULTISPECIES: NAD-dependent epimerase/dehydratase family protein [Kitasatospora]|uniref:Putative NAD-dependent epimerase/dehydratase n=1 Tax=Kitasatospora setae (strain ATCC 33774 / DSM 43861 / JCM 3304 / KCC A-0304 / NBRC 14216 / KM-6054) TaxID=452652 RepID=E4N0R5_KITSK|nr:NAD-dependent epimerase/dehydratase family protein [Kitasatospora setae]BAJ31749.1 putative NAD-dependent epimerase/dehydratase [Kitasatospora setae KM-6054]